MEWNLQCTRHPTGLPAIDSRGPTASPGTWASTATPWRGHTVHGPRRPPVRPSTSRMRPVTTPRGCGTWWRTAPLLQYELRGTISGIQMPWEGAVTVTGWPEDVLRTGPVFPDVYMVSSAYVSVAKINKPSVCSWFVKVLLSCCQYILRWCCRNVHSFMRRGTGSVPISRSLEIRQKAKQFFFSSPPYFFPFYYCTIFLEFLPPQIAQAKCKIDFPTVLHYVSSSLWGQAGFFYDFLFFLIIFWKWDQINIT